MACNTKTKCGGNFLSSFNGISPTQTITNYKDSEETAIRTILRNSWNNVNVAPSIGGKGRVLTPFRAVNNLGDYLGRKNYICGGPNAVNASRVGANKGLVIGSRISTCDGTNVAAGSGNSKFVSDSSDYITFKRQQATNQNYNDFSFGGYNNGSYVPLMRVRRFF